MNAFQSFTREELYELVWQTPMVRLAKRFGLSDVGLRKICKKNDIPTPPLGYWAKLEHGKLVKKAQLPNPGDELSGRIRIALRAEKELPANLSETQIEAVEKNAGFPTISVPEEKPQRYHSVAAATGKALRSTKKDKDGFLEVSPMGGVQASVGKDSVGRVLRIIDAFVRGLEARGHKIERDREAVRIVIEGVSFDWKIGEVQDRHPHEPTAAELKQQARRDEDRARWPSIYSSRREVKVYTSWDYFPSGRLSMTLTDSTLRSWQQGALVGRWHDRKNKKLEEYLDAAIAAMVASSVSIKHRLVQEAEKRRREAEELERRRREKARLDRAKKRYEYLLQKSEDHDQLQKLSNLARHLERQLGQASNEPADRLLEELKSIIEERGQNLSRAAISEEIDLNELYTEEDLAPSQKEEE